MRILSFIALGLILVLFIHPTSANHRATGHVGDNTVTYGAKDDRAKLIIDDASADQFVNYAYKLFVTCNGERHKTGIGAFDENSITNQGTAGHDTEYIFRNLVPNQIPCGIGEDYKVNMTFWDETPGDLESWSTGTLDVESTMDNPNKGQGIALMSDYNNGDSKIQDFFLVDNAEPHFGDDFPYETDASSGYPSGPDQYVTDAFPDGALIYATQADGGGDKDDNAVVVPDYGRIIEHEDSSDSLGGENLDGVALKDWTGSGDWFAGDQRKRAKDVLKMSFDGSHRPKFDQKCSLDDNKFVANTQCSPLHSNGDLKPQGDIIVASEKDTTFNEQDLTLTMDEGTYFFVCRDTPKEPSWGQSYTGDRPANSKVVKVREINENPTGTGDILRDEWSYYHCDKDNSWEEVECDPGQEVRRESGKLQCVEKDPVTVNVKMFNMSSIPRPSGAAGDNMIAGFKVESSEIGKYELFMGEGLKRIDAECWMGDDDSYPGQHDVPNDETGTFSLNYDNIGSGDAWVLGKIPYRNGVNNQTYSCIWGFSEDAEYGAGMIDPPVTNEGIYESTRNGPLRSVEGSRINVNYTKTIQPNYSDLAKPSELDESVDRIDLWFPYSAGDTRDYVTNNNEDMFDVSKEFPYCEQPPYSSTALQNTYDNIICSGSGGGSGGNAKPRPIATASQTSATPGDTINFDGTSSFDSDGTISSYSWNFDDGNSASGSTTSHTYSSTGTYSVELTVTDNDGATDTDAVTVDVSSSTTNSAPTADASATPTTVETGETVVFYGSGSSDSDGSINSYSWDFGDGSRDTGSTVSHSYSSTGTYNAYLTVTDDDLATSSDSVQINVESTVGTS